MLDFPYGSICAVIDIVAFQSTIRLVTIGLFFLSEPQPSDYKEGDNNANYNCCYSPVAVYILNYDIPVLSEFHPEENQYEVPDKRAKSSKNNS